jgi:hypothetical protein
VSDTTLSEGQMLVEAWEVQFKGRNRARRPVEEWVECRVVNMFHSTIYGGANGTGRTVEEARLEAVLGLARAICDDLTAFDHDADEIFKAEQLRWFQSTIAEQAEIIEDEESSPKQHKKAMRRIKLLEELQGIWQEDHDYWPDTDSEEAARSRTEARVAQIREHTARRRAASARISALAAAARGHAGSPEGGADHVLANGDGDDETGN